MLRRSASMRRIVVVACMGALLAACGGGNQADEVTTASSTVTGETTPSTRTAPETTTIPRVGDPSEPRELDVALMEIPFGVEPGGMTLDSGTIWVPSRDTGQLSAIDVGAGALRDTFTIGGEPAAVAVAEDSLWVTEYEFGDDVVRRVDRDTGEVTAEVSTPPGTHPLYVVGGAGAVWTTISGTEVARIDPATNEVVDIVSTSENSHPPGYGGLVYGFDSLWVIDYESGRLLRIDPSNDQIATTFDDLGYAAEDLGGGSVSVQAAGPTALAVTTDGLWVLSDTPNPDQPDIAGDGALFLIDPGSEKVVRRLDLAYEPDASTSPGLVITETAAWFIDTIDGSVVRVDLDTGFEDYVYTGVGGARGLVATPDTVWFSADTGGLFGIDIAEAARLAER